MSNPIVEELSPTLAYLPGSGAVVSFTEKKDTVTDRSMNMGKKMPITVGEQKVDIWSWGKDNLLPEKRELLVQDNNIVPELMATKRDITVGGGLMCYRERFVDGKRQIEEVEIPAASQEFFDRVDIDSFLLKRCRNLVFHANAMTEFIRDLGGRIFSIKALECRHLRPQLQNDRGFVRNWYWSGNWKEHRKPEFAPKRIPAYLGDEAKQEKFLMHTMDDILSDEYLGIPTWWGGRAWIECANAIPVFHINNLRNGYTIRYHIEIPKDYFWDYTAKQQTQAEKDSVYTKATEAKALFLEKLNSFLAGHEQAGRALITEYELDKKFGKDFRGIKITPINVDLKDAALLQLFERSNDANISAQGIHPTLAAIQTQGKLSSGSEIRNAFAMYVAIKTPVKRRLILRDINMVHKVNGWGAGLKWGFRDIEITKLDENPAGAQPVAVGQ